MEVSPLKNVKASELSLEQLTKTDKVEDAEKVKELSRQFEAVLVRQILQDAYKTVIPSSFSSDSSINSIYQDMITFQTAESITRSSSLGLARSLEDQLSKQILAKSSNSLNSTLSPSEDHHND